MTTAQELDRLREVAVQVAWSHLGRPYRWGGDDPMEGFDCSGFCVEILKSVGRLPRSGDWSAQGLYDHFSDSARSTPVRGALAFWGSPPKKIIHVEFMLDHELAIGASGGGPTTKTVEAATRDNAFIKIRPYGSRSGFAGFVDPFLYPGAR